jgi:hypothetical protein
VVILRPKSPNRNCRIWGPNQETLHLLSFEAQPRNRRHRFWGQTGENCHHRFWGQTGENCPSGFEAKPLSNHPSGFEAQPINRSLFGFEAQSKKPSWWFWGPNHQTVTAEFEAQTRKPSTALVLRLNQETIATGSEAKLEKTVATGFEAKPEKTVPVVLRPNHYQTILVVLRPNHSQTVDLGFEAQLRNPCSSSPRAWCRPHPAPSDLSITRPPSTRPVRPCSVLCTRSPTHAMILVAARHAAPATCTPWDKQTWFSNWNKNTDKTIEPSRIRIQTSPSQWLITIKRRNWPLGFSISPLTSPFTIKARSLKFESNTPWSTTRRPKSQKSSRRSSRRSKPAKANKRHKKSKKNLKPKQKLKNQHSP